MFPSHSGWPCWHWKENPERSNLENFSPQLPAHRHWLTLTKPSHTATFEHPAESPLSYRLASAGAGRSIWSPDRDTRNIHQLQPGGREEGAAVWREPPAVCHLRHQGSMSWGLYWIVGLLGFCHCNCRVTRWGKWLREFLLFSQVWSPVKIDFSGFLKN